MPLTATGEQLKLQYVSAQYDFMETYSDQLCRQSVRLFLVNSLALLFFSGVIYERNANKASAGDSAFAEIPFHSIGKVVHTDGN